MLRWSLTYIIVSHCVFLYVYLGFPDSSVGKECACNAGEPGSIPGSERSTEEGIGYPLHQASWGFMMYNLAVPSTVTQDWMFNLNSTFDPKPAA